MAVATRKPAANCGEGAVPRNDSGSVREKMNSNKAQNLAEKAGARTAFGGAQMLARAREFHEGIERKAGKPVVASPDEPDVVMFLEPGKKGALLGAAISAEAIREKMLQNKRDRLVGRVEGGKGD
jgi:hypothetical protein